MWCSPHCYHYLVVVFSTLRTRMKFWLVGGSLPISPNLCLRELSVIILELVETTLIHHRHILFKFNGAVWIVRIMNRNWHSAIGKAILFILRSFHNNDPVHLRTYIYLLNSLSKILNFVRTVMSTLKRSASPGVLVGKLPLSGSWQHVDPNVSN